MEVRGVAGEKPRHSDGGRRCAQCSDCYPVLEPLHQLLEHEDRARDRRVEGSGESSAVGWHPAVYFNQEGHEPHGKRLGCLVGVMSP